MISLRSALRRRLLTHFYLNRKARVYVRQLAAMLDVDSTNLSRELARLEREGLLRSEIEGRQRYFSINPDYPFLKPVFKLLQGTVGIEPTLASFLRGVEGIEKAYLYGSFARNEQDAASDIDLLVLGKPDTAQLAAEIARAEKVLRRDVNYATLTPEELQQKLATADPFLADVWLGPRIELFKRVGSDVHEQNQAATRK